MAVTVERMLGLFHCLPERMQIVAGGNYRKEQNKDAAKSADKDKRSANRVVRCRPALPKQVGRHQQGNPTKIKKKLHDDY
jgi:hypothetical protein